MHRILIANLQYNTLAPFTLKFGEKYLHYSSAYSLNGLRFWATMQTAPISSTKQDQCCSTKIK